MQAAAPHSGETILASPHRPRQGSGSFGYAIAVPPKGAVVLGLIFSAIAMGVVTVQVFMYSHRWYKERRTGVFILYGIFLYNLFSIAFLGEAVYHWLITGFRGGDVNYITVPQRYTLVMIPGVISRAIVSCILALITASLIHNGLVGLVLHVLTASRIALMAFVVQVTYQSFASSSSFGNVTPPLLKAHNALAMFTEALVCTLFGAAMYRESRGNSGTTNSGISQKNRQVILSYSFHLCVPSISLELGYCLNLYC
ncbi:hypothetical protein DL93DRAFT_513155 [Clavulina sp. PMI_390]|nr:hypothetical protein DL93DRAFT_513155 [Clavulina sp. PMI_390]